MVNYDIHVHTHLSSCGDRKAFMTDYISAAAEAGIETIGFADHAWDKSIPGASPWYAPQDYERLLSRREELKDIDTKGIRIMLGAEGEFAQHLLALGEAGRKYVDYVIVPHSHTHMKGVVLPEDCIGIPEKHADYLVRSFLALCKHKNDGLYIGIAHPMYPIGETLEYTEQIYSFITDSMLNECAYAAKEAGLMIEANLSVLKNIPPEIADSFCYRRFFDACKKAECDFSMGSDAHCIDVFRSSHANQASYIAEVGLNEDDFKSAQLRIQSV